SYSSPHHPHLHSFPTRRSSDLNAPVHIHRYRGVPAAHAICRRISALLVYAPRLRAGVLAKLIPADTGNPVGAAANIHRVAHHGRDRKSTRLNSSHLGISYAVFC